MKALKHLVVGCAVAGVVAVTANAHGFAPPAPARGATAGGAAAPAAGTSAPGTAAPGGATSGGSTARPSASAPGTARGVGGSGGGGGASGAGGRPRGGLPFGLRRLRSGSSDAGLASDAAGRKATPADLPLDANARGKAFKDLLKADTAKDSDVSYVLETTTTDARLRSVDLRFRVSERRRVAGDVRRRVEVDAKRGDQWETVEVVLLRRVAGKLEATRWTPGSGVTKVKDAADAAVAGTAIKLADLAPFDASGDFRYLSASEVDGAVAEAYRNATSSLDENVVTFRMDLRAPVRSEFRRGGELRRAYDWSGWRFVAGMPVPSRMTVTGAAGESAAINYREAAAVPAFDAKLFDAGSLGAAAN